MPGIRRTDRKAIGPGTVVVITGASAGVGRAAARAFASQGARIALLARGERGLRAAAEEVRAAGGQALAITADVADPDAVEAAATRAEEEFGPVGIWVNAAFATVFSPVTDLAAADVKRTTEVTYLGSVHGIQAALRRMLPRDTGTIVQVGSALAYLSVPLQSAYCGAKHAVQGFCDSVRTELRHEGSGVHLTTVQLPGVNTPQFSWVRSALPRHPRPVPPVYQPEVAARAILRAAAVPRRREYWVGGSTAATLVGNKLSSSLLGWYLSRTGYDSQQTDAPPPPDRPTNLWHPADGPDGTDYGAHGIFDEEAKDRSLQVWASRNRGTLAAGAAAAVAGTLAYRGLRG